MTRMRQLPCVFFIASGAGEQYTNNLTHQVLSPFSQLRRFAEASTSGSRSSCGFRRDRRAPREGREAKLFSAGRAKHDSVGHLLECRCAAATIEVLEALRHRASRSIEEADVIEREVLASFSAPLDSLLGVHNKLGNRHSLIYSQVERFGRKSTGVPVSRCQKFLQTEVQKHALTKPWKLDVRLRG